MTFAWIHPNASGGRGAPVEPSVRKSSNLPRDDGMTSALRASGQERRARAEVRHALAFDEVPQRVEVGLFRAAVVEQDRRARDEQAGNEQGSTSSTPRWCTRKHRSPARMSRCSESVLRLFEQDAAVALHDGLGDTRRARGIQDPERMIEGQRLEPGTARRRWRRCRRGTGRPTVSTVTPAPEGSGRPVLARTADQRHLPERRQAVHDLAQRPAPVVDLAGRTGMSPPATSRTGPICEKALDPRPGCSIPPGSWTTPHPGSRPPGTPRPFPGTFGR